MTNLKLEDVVISGIKSPVLSKAPEGKEDDSEAVVYIHGNPGSSADWRDLVIQTGEFTRAIAPDMPGYGKADRPKNFPYTVDSFARHINDILDYLEIEKVHLVLHDFGGCWGMQFASNHPEKVLSLSVINIGVAPGYQWHTYARIWRTPILGELFQLCATRSGFRMLLNRDNPKPFPREFTDRMFIDSDWGLSRGMLRLYRSVDDMGALSVSLGESLKHLNLPSMVLWGEGDKFVSPDYAEIQKDYFDAEVHLLPGCGHWPMIDEPDLVAGYLIPFLRKQSDKVLRENKELVEAFLVDMV